MTISATPGPGTGGQRAERRGARVAVPPGPHTDCLADHDGAITFTFAVDDDAPRWDAVLLQRRGGDQLADVVDLPLERAGSGRLRAVLAPTTRLPEGRWDVYVAGDGPPRRLRPGVDDLRTLVDRRPDPAASDVRVRIPYPTKYRNLSLRAWERGPHAEAERVRVGPEGTTLVGRLYGAELTGDACLEARARGGTGEPLRFPVAGRGRCFTVPLPCAELAACREEGADTAVWDLWLRPGGDAAPARIARLLDDVYDKSGVIRYPPLALPTAAATPLFTADNDLALQVRWAAA